MKRDAPKRSVAGVAVEKGKLFIAKRKAGGALGGKWEFPGGKVDGNESDEESLLREYQEELGVVIGIGSFLGSAFFEHNGTNKVNAYRIYFSDCDFSFEEHTEYRWASLDEIKGLDFVDSDRKLLPFVERYLNLNEEF